MKFCQPVPVELRVGGLPDLHARGREVGDYETAAVEMLDSRWADQVGARATLLAEMMRTRLYPGA